jgi:hypothetical protein
MNNQEQDGPAIEEKVRRAIKGPGDTVAELKEVFRESLEHAQGQATRSASILQRGLDSIIESLKDVVPEERKREADNVIKALEHIVPNSLQALRLSVEEGFGKGRQFVSDDGKRLAGEFTAQGSQLMQSLFTFAGRLQSVVGEESGRVKEHLEHLARDNMPHVQQLFASVAALSQGVAHDAATGISGLFQSVLGQLQNQKRSDSQNDL